VQRLPERPAGRGDLRLRLARGDLEREVEGRVLREQRDRVVEHGDAGRDVRLADAVHVDARLHLASARHA
jgi:hypothetical protein